VSNILEYYERNPKEVKEFIRDLTREITEKYGEYIDFMILYGSTARGEFVKGVSDIDMVIQLNEKADKSIKEKIIKDGYDIFWKLNAKYDLGFEKNIQTNIIEKVTPLYIPLFVFLPEDVDWKKGKFKKHYKLIVNLFTNEKSIFLSFKHEGIILYGRDIRKEINVKWSRRDKLKQLLLPFWLINGALFLLPFQLTKAKEYLIKAVSYAIINQIHLLERYDAITFREKIEVFTKHIKENFPKYSSINEEVNEVLKYKYYPEKVNYLWLLGKTYKIVIAYLFVNVVSIWHFS